VLTWERARLVAEFTVTGSNLVEWQIALTNDKERSSVSVSLDMAEYRIYLLDEQGSLHSPEELVADGDQQALEAAWRMTKFQKCEVWEGRRLVASLDGKRLADTGSESLQIFG
jgi:hypothetical protein